MGIIGPNGAGKSTLLKIITGTLFPTEGEVKVQGRVAALLELGTGFHSEFTGRLNIYLNGKMLGLSDEEIESRFGDIVRFSELGGFIEQPLRTYSSGMVMRLGFSIASCVDPDVLIIDEALSVGDAYFSQKCVRRIREFREQGVTILFVSHDPTAVLTLCDRALLLEEGVVRSEGRPEEVLDFYNARIAQRSSAGGMQILVRNGSDPSALGTQRSGNFRAIITAVDFHNAEGKPSEVFVSGETATLAVRVLFLEDVEEPTVGVLFRNRLGIEVFGANTMGLGCRLGRFRAGETTEVAFEFPLDLGPDDYSITVAIHLDETHLLNNFDWVDKAWRFRILPAGDFRFYGLAKLRPTLTVSSPGSGDADISEALRSVFGDPPEELDAVPAAGEAGTGSSPGHDRFFLDGWKRAEGTSSQRRGRIVEGRGRFVFRPKSSGLEVRMRREEVDSAARKADSRRTARLCWPGGSAREEEGTRPGIMRFLLPRELVGKVQVFSLVCEPESAGPFPAPGLEVISICSTTDTRGPDETIRPAPHL